MAQTMHRSQFCTSRETILVKLANPKGFYFEEGDFHGTVYETEEDAVASLSMDNAADYLRLDLDMHTIENVTEDMAKQWLTKFEGTPHDEDRYVPLYVRNSEAWDAWCEQYHIDNGIAFTQRSHGTYHVRGRRVA
jgi:hypothetical protein